MSQSLSSAVPVPSAASRTPLLSWVVSAIPWVIIAGLLAAGIFIRPQPVGGTVTPPALERRDHIHGLAALDEHTVLAAGSGGKILKIKEGAIERLATPTHLALQDIAVWDGQHAVAVGNDGVILISADAGASWQHARAPRSEIANKLNRVRVAEGGIAVATGEMGALLISRDYGQNWQRLREEEDVAWNDVAILADNRIVVVGEFGRLLVGDLTGVFTELEAPHGGSLMSVAFSNHQEGVAVGLEGAVLRTQDAGQSWQMLDSPMTEHLFDVSWHNGQWFAVGAQGLWLSLKGERFNQGLFDAQDLAWHVRTLATAQGLWVAGANVGLYREGQWTLLP